MIRDANSSYDGFSNLVGGVDDGRADNLIDKLQCEEANNAIFRGGRPRTRPPFIFVTLTSTNPNTSYDANGIYNPVGTPSDSVNNFRSGLFQEATYYAPRKGQEFLMATIGGRLYQITPGVAQTASYREIHTPTRNRSTLPIAFHLQADAYFIAQDGEAQPIIFDGVSARRAGIDEIPTGRMMGYGVGRIVLVTVDGKILFGDIYDGKGNAGADVLGFTETQFLNEGFASALPPWAGAPTAVTFLPTQDAATGVGDCLVFGERGVEAFTLSIPRDLWKSSQFQRPALIGVGGVGHRAVALVNQDIWFRSQDGWRSYRQARAEQDMWAQLPESTNVRKWIEADSPELLFYASAINFQNRLIGTCTPIPNQGKPYHNGALVLDFDILSTFGRTVDPAWDGHWSNWSNSPTIGLRLLRLVEGTFNGRHRAFAFFINPNTGFNSIAELMPDSSELSDTLGTITATMRTRAMDFGAEYNEKILYGGDIWVEDIQQDTNFTVNYRSDQVQDFSLWREFTGNPIDGVIEDGATVEEPGFKPRVSLPKPDDMADTQTNRILRRFYELQAEIIWTGRAQIRKLRARAKTPLEDSKANIEE